MLLSYTPGGDSSWKNLGGHGPGNKGRERGFEGLAPENFFDHAHCALRKCPILAQRLAIYTRKSCKSERANMNESRQNDREIKSTG